MKSTQKCGKALVCALLLAAGSAHGQTVTAIATPPIPQQPHRISYHDWWGSATALLTACRLSLFSGWRWTGNGDPAQAARYPYYTTSHYSR